MSQTARAPDDALFDQLGHRFADPALLELALLHPSASYERDGTRGNERLEFLGDAVLDLVIGQLLYEACPDWHEGDLTRARAALVNTSSLAAASRDLALGDYLVLGRTERRSGGREKDRALANLFEALVGAVYLDAGLEPVAAFLKRVFGASIERGELPERDPKTRLQEWAHREALASPTYEIVDDSGEQEDEGRFAAEVAVDGHVRGFGRGRTKQAAERAAAATALEALGV